MKMLTDWFNCKTDPPRYTGWYDFQSERVGNTNIVRYWFDTMTDKWFNFPKQQPAQGSPSRILSHCKWRGVYASPGEGFECEDQDTP